MNETTQPHSPTGADRLRASQALLEAKGAAEHPGCVMCSAANPFGLKLKFRVQNDGSVTAMFWCREVLQGYPKMLHGGIISALLDAAMTHALLATGVVAVTAELTVRFLAPVALDYGAVIRAAIEDDRSAPLLYRMRATLEQNRKVMARASAKFLSKDLCATEPCAKPGADIVVPGAGEKKCRTEPWP